jgi:hypothetical protein
VYRGWERMNADYLPYRNEDGYDLFQVALMLLTVSSTADRDARARRGAAEFSRRLGQLNGQVEDFEEAAAALEKTSVRAATCARRLRDTAERLTGLSAWGRTRRFP